MPRLDKMKPKLKNYKGEDTHKRIKITNEEDTFFVKI